MSISLALIITSLALAVVAPWLLGSGRWQVFRPRLALTLWFGSFAGGIAMMVAALMLTIVHAVTISEGASGAAVSTIGAWLSVLVLAGVLGAVSGLSEPLVDSYHRSLRRLTPVATSREDRDRFTLVRFSSDLPLAVAVPGRSPEILVSSAMERELAPDQLRAVLAHEYAHLRGHHGVLVRLAELNAAFLPAVVPAGRKLRRATRMLVELIADDVAARQAGSESLARALQRLAVATGEAELLVRAQRLRALPQAALPARGLPGPLQV